MGRAGRLDFIFVPIFALKIDKLGVEWDWNGVGGERLVG